MINPAQPPEGILDPQTPWWPLEQIGRHVWLRLKGQLTGRKIPELSNDQFASYVKLSDADADRLIENIKKYGKYPQLNKSDKSGGAYNEEPYQKWLVEEFLEKPFREQVDEKIEEKQIESRLKEIQETKKEIKEAETKEEVVAVIDDKVEVLEEIKEQIAPPRSQYQIPDPWEGSYTTPKSEAPQATVKKTKKRGRPIGTLKKSRKKKASAGGSGPTPPNSPPPKKSFATKFGGGLKKVGGAIGKGIINKLESGGPLGENQGPSVLGAGIWIGKKITQAFQDAKKEQARALEAEQNGAEVPPEVKEKGYFIKRALGYQFGGKVLDQTVGAFFENIPSKQSSKKAGFGDKFDYGEGDPKNKKQQNDIKDLATGFRQVKTALKGINKSIDQQVALLTQLIGETTRVADTLEAIQNSIGKQIDVEIATDTDQEQAQQSTGGDINIGDINIGGLGDGGINPLDILGGVDDVLDIAKLMRGKKKGLARQNPLYRRMRRSGGPQLKGGMPKGRFGMIMAGLNAGRAMFSEGGGVSQPVPAMIGEAGPELLIRNTPRKLAEGGVMQGGGSSILASGLGASKGLMKRVQPFANVMEMPLKVVGSQISGALSSLVAAAGPFSGAIAKMFSPLLGGLATIFGLNQGAFAAEINSSAMTEKEGAKTLSKFFANFFKIFGISFGEDDKKEENNNDGTGPENFEGSVNAEKAFNFFKSKGLSPEQSAGIVGNLIQESGVNPNSTNKRSKNTGIAQWDPKIRWPAFVNGITFKGKEWKGVGESGARQLENQLRYLYWEMDSGAGGMSLSTYKNATTLESATQTFLEKFERPGEAEAVLPQRITNAKGVLSKYNKSASKGIAQPITSSFANQVQGVFEMSGPDTGYKVPEDLTSGVPVVGHGLEWLVKMPNKFIILPGVNKEYDVYKDPAKAFNRYEGIAKQGGVDSTELITFMNKIIQVGDTPSIQDDVDDIKRMRAASLMRQQNRNLPNNKIPVGEDLKAVKITPIAIPKETASKTVGTTTTIVATQPVIKYITVPGPKQIIHVDVDPLVAASSMKELITLRNNQ